MDRRRLHVPRHGALAATDRRPDAGPWDRHRASCAFIAWSADGCAQHRAVPLADPFGGELRRRDDGLLLVARPRRVVGEHALQCRAECRDVARGHEHAGHVVLHDVPDAGQVARHDRGADRRGLEQGHRQALLVAVRRRDRRNGDDGRRGQGLEDLGAATLAEERHRQPCSLLLELGPVRAVTDDGEPPRHVVAQAAERLDQVAEALLLDQPPDGDHVVLLWRDARAGVAGRAQVDTHRDHGRA
ncbi:hypothetical protein EAH85_16230 [Curtobacterium flaccumfaciens]|nr:hypothetical protein EAH85_16230 [Curtobacterium flaccumfaciens]